MEKVYKEFLEAQHDVLSKEFPKSGFNKFGNFKYHELDDILPTIQEVCYKHGLLIRFEFRESEGVLCVNHVDNPQVAIRWAVPMPKLVELPRMNLVQSFGSYLTYIKRYLLINAFLITEKSVIDSQQYTEIQTSQNDEFQTAEELKENEKTAPPKETTNKVREPPEEEVLAGYLKELTDNLIKDGKKPTRKLLIFRANKYHKANPKELDLNDLKQLREYIKEKIPVDG